MRGNAAWPIRTNGFAPDARWAKPESLHVTLKFIGEQPEPAVDQIKHALTSVSASAIDNAAPTAAGT